VIVIRVAHGDSASEEPSNFMKEINGDSSDINHDFDGK
jgi:hypothetical protein